MGEEEQREEGREKGARASRWAASASLRWAMAAVTASCLFWKAAKSATSLAREASRRCFCWG